MTERILVTGALGCVGAWAVKAALDDGDEPVGYDLGEATHRLELVLSPDELERVTLVQGDITDLDALGRALDEHEITRVVHLAALQVPLCRADPVLGARVNVVGTVNVFEAVKQRLDRIPGVAYASSAASTAQPIRSPAPESGGVAPATLYGVYKLANEGTARLYRDESGVPSIGIRPYIVYGPGRDQGMTSGPTLAMAAAAGAKTYAIGYGGVAQYDYAPWSCSLRPCRCGSRRARSSRTSRCDRLVAEVVAAIEAAAPEACRQITSVLTPMTSVTR